MEAVWLVSLSCQFSNFNFFVGEFLQGESIDEELVELSNFFTDGCLLGVVGSLWQKFERVVLTPRFGNESWVSLFLIEVLDEASFIFWLDGKLMPTPESIDLSSCSSLVDVLSITSRVWLCGSVLEFCLLTLLLLLDCWTLVSVSEDDTGFCVCLLGKSDSFSGNQEGLSFQQRQQYLCMARFLVLHSHNHLSCEDNFTY